MGIRARTLIGLLSSSMFIAQVAVAGGEILDPIPTPITKGPVSIELQQVAGGMAAPVWATHAGDGSGRLFVADQAGRVSIIKNGATLPVPFLDVSADIVPLGVFGTQDESDFDERGLLGLAFHPDYNDSTKAGFGKVYTYTSEAVTGTPDFFTATAPPAGRSADHFSVIKEWSVDPANPDRIDPASGRTLMTIEEPQFNHNAGSLNFGPDGLLYVSVGDGGGADDQDGQPFIDGPVWGHGAGGNAQNLATPHGSVLRIDPLGTNSANGNYGIPATNPHVGDAGALDEIFAHGFRNPYRMSFDTATGDLIVADVGQNDIEEIDIVTAGGNYGWRFKEGSFAFDPNGLDDGFVTSDTSGVPAGLTDPVAEYDHDEGLAIVGGFVYRGSAIPELVGKYVFGDFSTAFSVAQGRLFYADLATGDINEFTLGLTNRDLGLFVKGFGQDEDGELYLLAGPNLGPFGTDGAVYRIVPVPAPGAGALAMIAGAGLISSRRRR